jgi:ribose transport system substrate-binding protein
MTQEWSLSRRYFINGATQIIAGFAIGGIVRPFAALAQSAADFEKKEWIIGFSNASETNTWRTALREAIEAEAKNYKNVKLFITDANDSPAKQVSDLEDLLAKNSNGLIIGAATTDVANPILERCWNDKIPVVIVDRKVNSDKYTTFVSSDNHYMATKALGKLIELVGGKGKIAIVEGIPGSGPAVERNIAYDELLKKNPGITAVRQAGDWSRASGQRVIENVSTANADLVGIHFDGGEMAVGGVQALHAAGVTDDMIRSGKPFLTWMDGYNGGLKLIKQGVGKYTILHPPRLHGSESVKALIIAFKGEPVPKKWPLQNPEITAANIDQFVAMDKPDDYWAL